MKPENDKYFSKTIEKGLLILSLFDRDHSKRSLSEISHITGINKTSVFRFVNTLVELGYLRKNSSSRLIRLGPKQHLRRLEFAARGGKERIQALSSIRETGTATASGGRVATGVSPNELTRSEDRDRVAGTPWHKHTPARVEAL